MKRGRSIAGARFGYLSRHRQRLSTLRRARERMPSIQLQFSLERPEFAQAVLRHAGLVWVGPSPEVITCWVTRSRRRIAGGVGAPLVSGSDGPSLRHRKLSRSLSVPELADYDQGCIRRWWAGHEGRARETSATCLSPRFAGT